MLVSLLLLLFMFYTQASCEWVEISQQHYLKPARTTRVYPQTTVIKDDYRTTKANRGYVNNSLSNPNWSKGAIYKIPSSEVKKLINSDTIRSKPINFQDKPTSEVRKKLTERVYYNKDNVRRITFTNTEEYLKPLEVLNLSDLDYDEEEFPTIEVDDGTISVEQFEHTKHLTADITTEDAEDHTSHDHTSHDLPNAVQSHTKNHDRKSIFTKEPTKKDLKVERTTPVGQNSSKTFQKESDLDSNSVNNSDIDNLHKVLTLKENSSSTSHNTKSEKIKQEDLKYRNKNSSNFPPTFEGTKHKKDSEISKTTDRVKLDRILKVDSTSQTTSHNLTQEKPRLEKNVLRIDELPKRSKIRNPEEVMLEEILHESDEDSDDSKYKTRNIGTVKKVSNKSTITKVYPTVSESKGKDSSFKPVESQIQMSKNKHIETVDTRETENHGKKNIIKESATTTTASSKIKESKEFETDQLNTPTPLLFKTENLFEPIGLNNPKEDRPDTVTIIKKNHNDEQEKKNEFVMTATSDQEETKVKAKPPLAETTATVKVEFTTKTSRVEDITTASDKKVELDKAYSQQPPAEKNVEKEHETEETLASDATGDTLGTLVKVLKIVTETISKNTRKTLRDKMRYLEELRDTIMASIEQRLEALFPDDDGVSRRARSAHAHAHSHGRGHVEFPSSESTLMTISFLTFAVFLIKLVLQVIQAYKHKAMVMPAVVATVGRAYHQYSKVKADEVK